MRRPSTRKIWLLGTTLVAGGLLLSGVLARGRTSPARPGPPKVPGVLQVDAGWYLRGGMLTGGFLGPSERAEWPEWMQAALDGRKGVPAEELARTDLYKIPDAFLPRAIRVLEENRVFTPSLLRQATLLGYTARAAEWQDAKTSYQVAWLKAKGLPVQDPRVASQLATQLAYRGEFELLRRALESAELPPGTAESWRRLLDLREGLLRPSEAWVLDRSRPAQERLSVLFALPRPAKPDRLILAFRGSDQLDLAVFHAVTSGWIPLGHPRVTEAIRLRKSPGEASFWLMNRPEERVSDLLWMRAMAALRKGARGTATACARTLLAHYPDSFYSGHADFLLAARPPADPARARPALRVPGDITRLSVDRFLEGLEPVGGPWPERFQDAARRNRFDLILAAADPETEEPVFLRAAFHAGQQDLVTRYMALEHRCTPRTLPFLYPPGLEPLVARLIREEGLEGVVDSAFVLAMLKNESIFQPTAQSGADAFGIMQLLRPTFARMMGGEGDILDPETNIRAGLRYYRTVVRTARLETLPEEVRMLYILAGYHAGEGRARRWRDENERTLRGATTPVATLLRIDRVPISSTRYYVLRVLGDREGFHRLLARP